MILDLSEREQTYIEDCDLCLLAALRGTPVCSRQGGRQAGCKPIDILFKTDGKSVTFFEAVK